MLKRLSHMLVTAVAASQSPTIFDKSEKRHYEIFSRLLKERIIWITDAITPSLASTVCAQLWCLHLENPEKPIHLFINSRATGGDVSSTLAIYDTMRLVHPPINTWCFGQASSGACLLLAAGEPGSRHCSPNASIMIHEPGWHGTVVGGATDVVIRANELVRKKNLLSGLLLKHTGQTEPVMEKAMERDTYMSANGAKDFGTVDHVTERWPESPEKEEIKVEN